MYQYMYIYEVPKISDYQGLRNKDKFNNLHVLYILLLLCDYSLKASGISHQEKNPTLNMKSLGVVALHWKKGKTSKSF